MLCLCVQNYMVRILLLDRILGLPQPVSSVLGIDVERFVSFEKLVLQLVGKQPLEVVIFDRLRVLLST